MFNQVATGERVRRLRVMNGLTQIALSAEVGMVDNAVSRIENGKLSVSAEELSSIADRLDCTTEYLLLPHVPRVVTRPWLRAYADASQKAVERTMADSETAVEVVEELGLRRLPDRLPLFDGDLENDDAIERFAGDVRAHAGLDDADVVRNCIRAAERLGCVVLPMDDELGRHLGLSTRIDDFPVIRVSRSSVDPERSVPGDRQRFTVAHEIGHLAMHHSSAAPSSAPEGARFEKQAHRFAAAFLAPADPIIADLDALGGRVTLATLAQLKERWGVAIKALVMRFHHLGVIDSDHARSLYKQMSARKMNKVEPVSVSTEDAQWLRKAVERKSQAHDPLRRLADDIGLAPRYLEQWWSWEPAPADPDLATVHDLASLRVARKA
jgi:Zn-dependent peptidase ImmA (M78 family)/transcriptional regulator with XRE-family HTH domain